MAIVYDKLFDVLSELGMKNIELQDKANITASIMARLARNESVRTDTINKICKALQCQPGDIMEYIDIEVIDETVILRTPNLNDEPDSHESIESMSVERARRLGLL